MSHFVCVVIFLTLNLVIIDISMMHLLVKISETEKERQIRQTHWKSQQQPHLVFGILRGLAKKKITR